MSDAYDASTSTSVEFFHAGDASVTVVPCAFGFEVAGHCYKNCQRGAVNIRRLTIAVIWIASFNIDCYHQTHAPRRRAYSSDNFHGPAQVNGLLNPGEIPRDENVESASETFGVVAVSMLGELATAVVDGAFREPRGDLSKHHKWETTLRMCDSRRIMCQSPRTTSFFIDILEKRNTKKERKEESDIVHIFRIHGVVMQNGTDQHVLPQGEVSAVATPQSLVEYYIRNAPLTNVGGDSAGDLCQQFSTANRLELVSILENGRYKAYVSPTCSILKWQLILQDERCGRQLADIELTESFARSLLTASKLKPPDIDRLLNPRC